MRKRFHHWQSLVLFLAFLPSVSWSLPMKGHGSDDAFAVSGVDGFAMKKRSKKVKKNRSKVKAKQPVEIPIDVGIGPAVYQFTGRIQEAQKYHFGVKLSLAAIIDREIIASQKHRIPKKYQGLVKKVNTVRLRPGPLILVPDSLYISPEQNDTAIYGATWRPISIGLPLLNIFALGTGLNVAYAYVSGSNAIPKTHFLRPGLDATVNLEIPLSKNFLVSMGWTSLFCPPQTLGGEILSGGPLKDSIWHIGQGYLRLHFRIPYRVNL